jgi:hypothetical protein
MLQKNTHIHKIVLFILLCGSIVVGATSIYVWYLLPVFGLQLIIPAIVLSAFSVVCIALFFYAVRKYRNDQLTLQKMEKIERHKLSVIQENVNINQAMHAWILTMRNFADKYPDVKETLNSFEKVFHDVRVPSDVYGVMEKLTYIGRKARKHSHRCVQKRA